MFNLEILWLIAFCYHGGGLPVLWEREMARFAGISDRAAAEKVIVQENSRGEAGGWVAVPEKLWRKCSKMHS